MLDRDRPLPYLARMQRIEIAHVFEGTPEDYLAVIDAADFPGKLCQVLNLKERSLLLEEDRGDHVFVQWRVVPTADMPGPVKAALGGKGLAFIEEEKRPKARPAHRDWNVLFEALGPKRFRCSGTFDLIPEGNGTKRVLSGEVDVKLLGIGGIVERHVASGMAASYEKTSQLMRDGIAARIKR